MAGLAEMRRVTDGPVVILTFDRDALDRLWLKEYAPGARGGRRHSSIPRCADPQSAWTFLEPGIDQRVVASLADDLASRRWDERFGHLVAQPWYVGAVRMITGGGRRR